MRIYTVLLLSILFTTVSHAQEGYKTLPAIMVGASNNLDQEQAEVAVLTYPNPNAMEDVKPGDFLLWYDTESNQFQCEIKNVNPIPTKINAELSMSGPFYQVSIRCLSKFLDSKIASEFQNTRNVLFVSSSNRPDYLPGDGR